MTELVNTETGEIVAVHPEEPGAVAMLDQAINALTTALDQMPISEVVNLKAKVATVQTATKELGMSKEAQDLAAEAVRRAEWSLRRIAQRAQEAGEIKARGDNLIPGARTRNPMDPTPSDPRPSVKDFFRNKDEYEGANAMAALEPEQFDEVIAEARGEGNLSRANVARKAREKKGCDLPAPKPKRKPLPDAARDAGWDLRKSVERLQRIAADDRFAAHKQQVAPHLRSHLENAIEVCQDLLNRINNN